MITYVKVNGQGNVTVAGSAMSVDEIPQGAILLPEGANCRAYLNKRFTEGEWVDRDDLPIDPPPDPSSVLRRTIVVATKDLNEWLDRQADSISGVVPMAERATWDAKDAAVQRVLNNTATPRDMKFIEIESAIVDEPFETTVAKIATNAAMFYIAGPVVSGLRRKAANLFSEALTPEDVEQALQTVKNTFYAIMADAQSFAADPTTFLQGLEI